MKKLILLLCLLPCFGWAQSPEPILRVPTSQYAYDWEMLPDGNYVLVTLARSGDDQGGLKVYDSRRDQPFSLPFKFEFLEGYRITSEMSVELVQKGNLLVIFDFGRRHIYRYDLVQNKALPRLGLPYVFSTTAVSQDGRYIFAGHTLFDTQTGKEIQFKYPGNHLPYDAHFTQDGQHLYFQSGHRDWTDRTKEAYYYLDSGKKAKAEVGSLEPEKRFTVNPERERSLGARHAIRILKGKLLLVEGNSPLATAFYGQNEIMQRTELDADAMPIYLFATTEGNGALFYQAGSHESPYYLSDIYGIEETPEVAFYYLPDLAAEVSKTYPTLIGKCVSGDCQNGKGRFEISAYNYYEGNFERGMKEGQGLLVYQGKRYEGNFSDGKLWGQIKVSTQDGQLIGTYLYYDGGIVGQCLEGNCSNGSGTLRYEDGTIIKGTFRYGEPEGIITMTQPNGDIYRGSVGNNQKFHGLVVATEGGEHTTYVYVKGERWGECLDGCAGNSQATIRMQQGYTFEGGLNNMGAPSGYGVVTTNNGTYKGSFNDGIPTEGTLVQGDHRFEGKVDESFSPKHGRLYMPNGNYYEGYFREGVPHGDGYLYFPNGNRRRVKMDHGKEQ